jgi:hypothetical protein
MARALDVPVRNRSGEVNIEQGPVLMHASIETRAGKQSFICRN